MASKEATLPRPRRRWPLYLIAGLVVLFVVLWIGGWFAAARVAEAALSRATSSPIGGISFGCPDRSLSGFPLRIDVRCQRATASDAAAGLQASLGGFWASAPLYWPGFVEATLDGPLQLNAPSRGLALTASWSSADATASAWLTGLSGGSVHLQSLGLKNGGRADALPVTQVNAKNLDAGVSPIGGGSYRITMNASGLTLTRSDGGPFPETDTSATLTAEGVGDLGTNPAATIAAWMKNGGRLQIDNLRIAAAGAVLLVNGTVTLSKDGYINGPIVLAYNNIDGLGKFIDALRPGTATKNAGNLQQLDRATRVIATPEGEFHQTALLAVEGRLLFLGILPLPLDPIPPIRF